MTSAPVTGTPAGPRQALPPQAPAPFPTRGRERRPEAGPPSGMERARAVVSGLLEGTPGRMRLIGAAAVAAALALGAASANAVLQSRAAVERAANNTAQVVRVQSIHVDLLRADAIATNAFLVGGLEPPEQRAAYDAAMSRVARSVAAAAAAQPADGRALGALSDQVQKYGALVEQARSNNRLGLPVGAQYLKQASAGLRADAIPILAAISKANEHRSAAEFGRAGSRWQLVIGVLGIAVLAGVAVWLARRTHRYLNLSLTGATALVLLALLAALWVIGSVDARTTQVADNDYAHAVALADVRTAANDARSNESLTLIARGSGSAFEKAWQADAAAVRASLQRSGVDVATEWNAYAATHTEIRRLDDTGEWDAAVARATTLAASGAGAQFSRFDQLVTAARDRASAGAVDTLDGIGRSAPVFALLIGLVALVASWLVVRGIGQRIEEYK